jgi:hypothetical protein
VVGSGLTATIVEQVLSTMLGALLAGIVTSLVGKAIIGQRVDGAEVVRPVLRRFWGLVLVSLIVGLVPFAPLLLVIGIALVASSGGTSGLLVAGLVVGIPASLALGIFLWGKLALAVPAFVLERLGPWKAVTRSWRLVKGAFWRVWGLRALMTLIVGVASFTVALPFQIASGAAGGGFSGLTSGEARPLSALVIGTIGAAVAWMLVQPLLAAALTLIYVDRRMRAEGLDLQLTQAALANNAAAVPPQP